MINLDNINYIIDFIEYTNKHININDNEFEHYSNYRMNTMSVLIDLKYELENKANR